MFLNLYFSTFLIVYFQCICVQTNAHYCISNKLNTLSPSECSDLYFNYKSYPIIHDLFQLNLIINNENFYINISQQKPFIDETLLPHYIRLTSRDNKTNEICSIIENNNNNVECLPVNAGETYILEIKTSKYLFTVPNSKHFLFPYVEVSDSANLILRLKQKPENTGSFTIEAFKEKNNITTLQDVHLYDGDDDILFNFVTYNDPGAYFFTISSLDEKISTPKVYIGRKSTRLVIGIVGASFILPFVLFIFHLLTKQYKQEEISDEKIIIIYKSSFDKQNQIVSELNRVLQQSNKTTIVVEASKVTKKLCSDLLTTEPYIIYVAPLDIDEIFTKPPKNPSKTVLITFDYIDDNFKHQNLQKFQLMSDFNKLITFLDVDNELDSTNLAKLIDEVASNLPKIVITDSDLPKAEDKLINCKTDF